MHSELQDVIGELDSAVARLRELARRTTEAQWAVRPDVDRWSIAECVTHLNLTSASVAPLLRRGVDEARRSQRTATGRYRRDFAGWLLWKSVGPPVRVKIKTTPPFVPRADRPKAEVIAEFERYQAELTAMVREADGLPIDRVKIVSPFNSRLRYNVFAAFSILARHQHRHLWQAEQVAHV